MLLTNFQCWIDVGKLDVGSVPTQQPPPSVLKMTWCVVGFCSLNPINVIQMNSNTNAHAHTQTTPKNNRDYKMSYCRFEVILFLLRSCFPTFSHTAYVFLRKSSREEKKHSFNVLLWKIWLRRKMMSCKKVLWWVDEHWSGWSIRCLKLTSEISTEWLTIDSG